MFRVGQPVLVIAGINVGRFAVIERMLIPKEFPDDLDCEIWVPSNPASVEGEPWCWQALFSSLMPLDGLDEQRAIVRDRHRVRPRGLLDREDQRR